MARTATRRRTPGGGGRASCASGPGSRGPGSPRLLRGDCIEVMAGLEEASVDAVVCDPPYGIGYQNERWDSGAIREAAAGRGHGSPTMNQAFETWCGTWGAGCARLMKPGAFLLAFGSPRTHHRLTCGLEEAGLEIRDTLMWLYGSGMPVSRHYPGGRAATLKPAFEPIVLARKPLDGTTVETIGRHGTGVMNTDACRVEGRHPANVLVAHEAGCAEGGCAPDCAVALLDGEVARGKGTWIAPSRFLYCPKPSRAERDAGCEALPSIAFDLLPNAPGRERPRTRTRNPHPTLKPLELMRWLVRLTCPDGGLVLDPFMGSGTTGAAAAVEGRRFCGIESDRAYLEIAAARITHWSPAGCGGREAGAVPLGRRR